MGLNTHISWATDTINFGWGCTSVSDACAPNCYIPTTPPLRQRHMKFDRDTVGGTTGVVLRPDAILKPLSWPYNVDRRVFLNSLTDTFHAAYDSQYIARQFAIAAVTPRWIWLVLTKRHARMRALLSSDHFRKLVEVETERLVAAGRHRGVPYDASGRFPWPLPNVMLGVTVEQQRWAAPRLDALLDTPAAGRFVSAEPLLEDLDIEQWLADECGECQGAGEHVDGDGCLHCHGTGNIIGVDWVITGGESGRLDRIRRTDPEWIDDLAVIVGQTNAQFHLKQLGALLARELGCADRNGRDPGEWPTPWQQDVPTLPFRGAPA